MSSASLLRSPRLLSAHYSLIDRNEGYRLLCNEERRELARKTPCRCIGRPYRPSLLAIA